MIGRARRSLWALVVAVAVATMLVGGGQHALRPSPATTSSTRA